jgi:gamma-glutamyltranspeptidase / glutathione hydrolase
MAGPNRTGEPWDEGMEGKGRREPDFDHWPRGWPYRTDARPVTGSKAMVCTTDRYATEVGLEVLRDGGNAVDAAVATSFALAVVNPEAGNLGGSGYLVARECDGSAFALDFRSRAPLSATPDMFLDGEGEVGDRPLIGHLAAAAPGTVRGLWEAHRRLGRASWRELLEPAIRLARGFVVTARFLRSYTPDVVEGLSRFPSSREIFLPGGQIPRVGEIFRQVELGHTLERIRDQGSDGFHAGETADRIAHEMDRGGGRLTREDLGSYRAIWRDPIRFRYRGHTILSVPPSSSGGVTLAEMAHILASFPIATLPWHGPEHVHLLVEAWRRAYADRNHFVSDPDFGEVPTDTLLSPAYGSWRGRDIEPHTATPSDRVSPEANGFREGTETTHLSIVDPEGNAVSLTTTLNTWYGCKLVVPGTGILLNNDMDDFSVRPGAPNYFGLVQGTANAIAPGKRMTSAMTPVIALRPSAESRKGGSSEGECLWLVLGTPGGATIITTVFQILSNLLDHGLNLSQAVLAPRLHHQHLPDQIWTEPGGVPPAVADSLRAMGHRVVERDELSGDAQAILVDPTGTRLGQADPRRGGVAMGF